MENKLLHRLLFASAAVCALALSGCAKKELPQAQNGEPVFYFKGTIGQDQVDYQAGINGLYMFTDYYKDQQSLYTLRGVLAQDNCSTCEPFLSVEFKDAEESFGSSLASGLQFFFRDSVFNSFSMDSIVTQSLQESFAFFPKTFYSGASYTWDFGDGSSSSVASPSHTFTTEGIKNIRLKASMQGTTDSLVIPIDVTPLSTCRTRFSFSVDSMTNKVYVISDNLSFASYLWDFGNGSTGTGLSDTAFYPLPGVYTIKLTSNVSGCASMFMQKVNMGNNPLASMANFSYTTSFQVLSAVSPRINRNTCIITYRKNGKVYQSYKNIPGLDQSGQQVLRVKEVASYQRNAADQATLVIKADVDTYLYNVANPSDSVRMTGTDWTMGVAYPD